MLVNFDLNAVLARVNSLALTPRQQSILKKFKKNQGSRDFLPLFYLLEELGFIEEACAFLHDQINVHPTFITARLILAEKWAAQAKITEAWELMAKNPVDANNHKQWLKLKLQLAIFRGEDQEAKKCYKILAIHHDLDANITRINDLLTLYGTKEARRELIQIWQKSYPDFNLEVENTFLNTKEVDLEKVEQQQSLPLIHYADFRLVPLKEVFTGGQEGAEFYGAQGGVHMELDTVTLADIYEKQGFYAKAAQIYQRLVKVNPRNTHFKKKIEELSRYEQEQKEMATEIDRDIVEKMENIDELNQKIFLFEDLLTKLR